jgi:hypothetical protein
MVRLGYSRCDACHFAPQGAGLLTDYGKGIDEAQSLRRGEYRPPSAAPLLRYDLRLLTSAASITSENAADRPTPPAWLRGYARTSMTAGAHNRFSSTVFLESPHGAVERLWQSRPAIDATAAWELRPLKSLTLAVARDRLPRGVELGITRTVLDEAWNGDRLPTQLKAVVSSDRIELTGYVSAPGSGTGLEHRAYGSGALGAVHLFNGHLVLGSSARRSTSDLEDQWSGGGYTRLGTGTWGVLSEHELAHRTRTADPLARSRRYAGYTQFFVAPREWLVASFIGEQVVENGQPDFRWRPEVQARLTSHITVSAGVRQELAPDLSSTSRMYLVQFALKTVQ